jgi:hypothetical protein
MEASLLRMARVLPAQLSRGRVFYSHLLGGGGKDAASHQLAAL